MRLFFKSAVIALFLALGLNAAAQGPYTLSNGRVGVSIGEDGSLVSLRNEVTGEEYASGAYMWRLYYDSPQEKEIQIVGEGMNPEVFQKADTIFVSYSSLVSKEGPVDIQLTLSVTLDDDLVRFASALTNNQPHTVVRELHYPLVHGAKLPSDHKLFTAEAGGKLYGNPLEAVGKISDSPYKKPEQIFRQKDVKYGAKVFMNCFGLFGENQGLYFGSHDATFQDTWHGMRVYNENGRFDVLEFGFFKYPHCFCGESWECDANVIAPYTGTWHVASRIYRRWADTWWDHRRTPDWVLGMKSWQRVIFKHQYGERLFSYSDLNGKVDQAGQSVGCNAH
ncbi:MAG: hypothetical protein J6W82_01735, partial [Bacteroidales bacterium]|nr:hypothetical protein [Bacteroidales bacterium]